MMPDGNEGALRPAKRGVLRSALLVQPSEGEAEIVSVKHGEEIKDEDGTTVTD